MAIWIALAVFLVGVLGGVVFAAIRGFQLWRRAKRAKSSMGQEAERIARVADEITLQLDRAAASSARLTEATERLRSSARQLEIQLAAVREARALIRRALWFVPGV